MTGRLIYVVGASGVGKDTVLGALRNALDADDRIAIAHRYITRPATAGGENHIALGEHEFLTRLNAGCFALNWHSHGFHYGIGREIEVWLARGLSVLINGSRAYWPTVRARYPHAQRVHIIATADTIRARMRARGRETNDEITARLLRNSTLAGDTPDSALRICNDGRVEDAVATLLGWLREAGSDATQPT